MTIDEAIAHQREVAEKIRTEHNCECDYYDIDIDCVKCAEEHKQLAEWLEELKAIKENQGLFEENMLREEADKTEKSFYCGYNRAIDDAKSIALKTIDNEMIVDTLHLRLEQLKAGGDE